MLRHLPGRHQPGPRQPGPRQLGPRQPGPHLGWQRSADVVVVGSGAAGMAAALTAAAHGRHVLLLAKGGLAGGATPLAQGGLAAVVGTDDSPGRHQHDTLVAGVGLCEVPAVAALVTEAPEVVEWLCRLGARLERGALHLEGGHTAKRIVHAGGDAIGAEVHRVLRDALLASEVDVVPGAVALDVVTGDAGEVRGVLAGLPGRPLRTGLISAPAVVLATGGYGQVYATTTNPAGLTGDGLALAARLGAEVCDVEFVQFHPTVFWQPGARGQCLLVTEALRGAGAVLVDAAGQPVMAGRHPLGDLAPRDVVSAAMRERMTLTGADHLWLDATALGRPLLEAEFPTVTSRCRALGVDPATQPIPVAPGAHYACGGIRTDLDGRTSVAGLYAVGEAASTGVHGANRLASNSVTEALASGRRVGDLLGQVLPPSPLGPATVPPGPATVPPGSFAPATCHSARAATPRTATPGDVAGVTAGFRPALAAAMSRHAGVVRDAVGLSELLAFLERAPASGTVDLATVEATNLHTVATLVAVAALAREESRGCHRRSDAPAAAPGVPRHTVLRWQDERLWVSHPAVDGAVAGQPAVAAAGVRG